MVSSPSVQLAAEETFSAPTGIAEVPSPGFALHRAVPNPFNPQTAISYDLPRSATVTLTIHDLAGRLVRVLIGGEERGAGSHSIAWRGSDDQGRQLPSGTYFYRLEAGDYVETRRMMLIR